MMLYVLLLYKANLHQWLGEKIPNKTTGNTAMLLFAGSNLIISTDMALVSFFHGR